MPKSRVFVDTNIIIEAFGTKTWTALCNTYQVETVDKCVAESLAGDQTRNGYVKADEPGLKRGLAKIHEVDKAVLSPFRMKHSEALAGLHAGEMELFAFIESSGLATESLILISTADGAAVKFACQIGWIDCLISLEAMLRKSGVTGTQIKGLRRQYSKDWLESWKTDARISNLSRRS